MALWVICSTFCQSLKKASNLYCSGSNLFWRHREIRFELTSNHYLYFFNPDDMGLGGELTLTNLISTGRTNNLTGSPPLASPKRLANAL